MKMKAFLLTCTCLMTLHTYAQKKEKNYPTDITLLTLITPAGKHNQFVRKYDSEGRLSECGYRKKELKNKTWISYDSEGNISVLGNFEEGIRSGTWLVFDGQGKIIYEIIYEKNRIISATAWEKAEIAEAKK